MGKGDRLPEWWERDLVGMVLVPVSLVLMIVGMTGALVIFFSLV